MAKNFPADEFDSVTAPGGRHRARRTPASRVVSFSRYAAVTVALGVVGILTLDVISGTSNFTDVISGGSNQAVQSGFNANGLGVTVIDASDKTGLASKVAHRLYGAGWNVLTATNSVLLAKLNGSNPSVVANPNTTPSASPTNSADSTAIGDKTVVYVTTASAKNAASDLLKTLGNYSIVQSNQYADPITVVLGNDYR